MKNYLLTEFTKGLYSDSYLDSIKSQIDSLNERAAECELAGELYPNEINDGVNVLKISHFIKHLTFENGKIYGDVEFLKNERGQEAQKLIDSGDFIFNIRVINSEIIAWDIICK